jgi:hypothetical protein
MPGLRALIGIVSGLPTIIAAAILGRTVVVVVVSRGCTRLEWLLLFSYGTGSSLMACSEMGSPSSVQLKMNGEDPKYVS